MRDIHALISSTFILESQQIQHNIVKPRNGDICTFHAVTKVTPEELKAEQK